MADYVKQATGAYDSNDHLSKGVRMLSGSRDIFADCANSFSNTASIAKVSHAALIKPHGMSAFHSDNSNDSSFAQIPFFGTNALVRVQDHNSGHIVSFNGGSSVAFTGVDNSGTGSGHNDVLVIDSDVTLANNTVKTAVKGGQLCFVGYDLVTPIHTSHHYQTFETPFLNELIGGDRNMEQTNLVCSPDGKTWDEITRDTSYIGTIVLQEKESTSDWVFDNTRWVFDKCRGKHYGVNCFTKNRYWVHSYDRYICLETVEYEILVQHIGRAGHGHRYIYYNGTQLNPAHEPTGTGTTVLHFIAQFHKGDEIYFYDETHGNVWSTITIKKL